MVVKGTVLMMLCVTLQLCTGKRVSNEHKICGQSRLMRPTATDIGSPLDRRRAD